MARSKKKTRRKVQVGLRERLARTFSIFAMGREMDEETAEHLQEIKGLVLVGAALWLFLSLVTYQYPFGASELEGPVNWGGQAGFYVASWVYLGVGWGGYLVSFLALTWGIVLVARKRIGLPTLRIFGGLSFLAAMSLMLEMAFGASNPKSNELPYGPGGWLAGMLVGPDGATEGADPILIEKLGGPGLWVLLLVTAVVSFMLATEMAFYPAVSAFREWMEERRDERGESLPAALFGWCRRFFAGLWSFLSGADLEARMQTVPAVAPKKKPRSKAKSKPKAKAKPKLATAELFEEEDEAEAEEEGDDEWEWEYEEEDPAAELEEGEEEDPEDEWEEEEEWEEVEEYAYDDDEEEEEPEVELKPTKKAGKKAPKEKKEPAKKTTSLPQASPIPQVFDPPTPPPGDWKFPSLDILEPPRSTSHDETKIEDQARRLENALASFRVEASVVGAKVGASVTMFELEVAQGTRMNKVTTLSQEIAAALRAKSVRIIAPIPGKATVGIEVPNEKRRVVRLSELISQKAYDKKFMSLPLFLGMDAEGAAVVEDLARMPHLLIAGTTGSGKSVCINTILASFLLTRSPHDVKLILVDPKMVELQMFANVPHLMLPVVSDTRQATNVLLWAVEKMEGRYELFKDAGVRNLKSYNDLGEEGLRQRLGDDFNEERTPRHVPAIVIVIDEMADLMMTSKKEAEQSITRLAQKSRAVGIHVIVATQRPSTDVITGVLKGNLPTRIAFQVASKVDSRVILDVMGAEKLLGQGDMLYTPPQSSQIRRVQGALVEDHEIQGIVEFVCQESAPTFSQELVQSATGTAQAARGTGAAEDDLWDEAVRVILKSRRGSASLLQRALGIGYTRASRLIDLMTAEGIVGEHKGSKAREVLMSLDDWEEQYGSSSESADAGAGAAQE